MDVDIDANDVITVLKAQRDEAWDELVMARAALMKVSRELTELKGEKNDE